MIKIRKTIVILLIMLLSVQILVIKSLLPYFWFRNISATATASFITNVGVKSSNILSNIPIDIEVYYSSDGEMLINYFGRWYLYLPKEKTIAVCIPFVLVKTPFFIIKNGNKTDLPVESFTILPSSNLIISDNFIEFDTAFEKERVKVIYAR